MKLIHLLNKLMKYGFPIYALYRIIIMLTANTYSRIAVTASVFFLVLVPYLLKKIFHYKMTDIIEFIYLIFIFLAVILGSVVNLYSTIWWWDILAHTISGILTSIVALLILKRYNCLHNKKALFVIIFMVTFSLGIASLWEFFEFAADNITGGDTQWVLTTGVDDTMIDMLVAFLGTSIFSIYYFIVSKTKSKSLTHLENLL
ncbi:MAG: hypothetical protein RR406_02525 [Bacilli bacterium]